MFLFLVLFKCKKKNPVIKSGKTIYTVGTVHTFLFNDYFFDPKNVMKQKNILPITFPNSQVT